MAKKRKKKRSVAQTSPKHSLPDGFWRQVWAILLVVLSLLLVVSWFGTGGPVLEWLSSASLATIGYASYAMPVLLVYIAVMTFRVDDNKLPLVVKFASLLVIVWLAGLFGLLKSKPRPEAGGFIGDFANGAMLAMVDSGVAALLYILLIFITTLFITQVSPFVIISKIGEMIKRDDSENENNREIIKKASRAESETDPSDIKLNAGVPVVEQSMKPKKVAGLVKLRDEIKIEKPAEEQSALVLAHDPNWKPPSMDLLEKKESPADVGDYKQNAQIIHDTLSEFGIDVEMEDANTGPRVTQYTLKPPSGVKLARITALEPNIALSLAAQNIRIEAPIPGKRAVGIEVPNRRSADVRLYGILKSPQWQAAHEPLSFAIGKDISGQSVIGELNKMPHLLIAGQTGAGKSVMINTLLCSLLYRNSPSDMKLILVDPKRVEMKAYEDIPHLLTPIINEPEKTISALKWAVNEMERRYSLLGDEGVKDIAGYNRKVKSRGTKIAVADEAGNIQQHEEGAMPYIVIIIDELADLMMMAQRDVESLIVRLAQKARAVGVHLVLATQRPSVNVITGLIKANVPSRIGFTVAQQVDSRTILDQSGAEKLLNQGDMLMITPSMSKPKRVQGAWVTEDEVGRITDHLRMQSPPQYNDDVVAQPVQLNGKGGVVMDFNEGGDDIFKDAVRVVIQARKASTTLLQNKLRIGYPKASRIMSEMEEQGVIGPADGSKPREVMISSLDDLDMLAR